MFNQNTSFIKNSLSRTGEEVKELYSDPDCKFCSEDDYCGTCRLKFFKVDYETMLWYIYIRSSRFQSELLFTLVTKS